MNSVPLPLLCYTVSILMRLQESLDFSKEPQRSDMRQQKNETGTVKGMHKYQRVSLDYVRKVKLSCGCV